MPTNGFFFHSLLLLLFHAFLVNEVAPGAEFDYVDFNTTEGLQFNGVAHTSSCTDGFLSFSTFKRQTGLLSRPQTGDRSPNVFYEVKDYQGSDSDPLGDPNEETAMQPGYWYSDYHGLNFPTPKESFVHEEHYETVKKQEAIARYGRDIYNSSAQYATFGHREQTIFGLYGESPQASCGVRIRLTPSVRAEKGSVFRQTSNDVLRGFTSWFTFQITDLSETCISVNDTGAARKELYRTCNVKGADGFAFVIHSDDRGSEALGDSGLSLGFGGNETEAIRSSLAISFDHGYNPEVRDPYPDHVSIFAGGVAQPTTATSESWITKPATHIQYNPLLSLSETIRSDATQRQEITLAEGSVHFAKIRYFPYVNHEILHVVSATQHGTQFIKESENMGTLAVYLDEMNQTKPLVAVLLNLKLIIGHNKEAFVGFTASTGERFAKHDILSWKFVEGVEDEFEDSELGSIL